MVEIVMAWTVVMRATICTRRDTYVGNLDLRKGNTFLRSRTSAALGILRDAAVHRLLDTCTETTLGWHGSRARR